MKLPQRRINTAPKIKYTYEEKLILERIQQIRDDLEYNKKELKKKRENEYERIQRQGSKSSRW